METNLLFLKHFHVFTRRHFFDIGEITDKGSFFDSTVVADVDLPLLIEERSIGGFSILLIRCIINEVSYQRLGGENRLTMKKSL